MINNDKINKILDRAITLRESGEITQECLDLLLDVVMCSRKPNINGDHLDDVHCIVFLDSMRNIKDGDNSDTLNLLIKYDFIDMQQVDDGETIVIKLKNSGMSPIKIKRDNLQETHNTNKKDDVANMDKEIKEKILGNKKIIHNLSIILVKNFGGDIAKNYMGDICEVFIATEHSPNYFVSGSNELSMSFYEGNHNNNVVYLLVVRIWEDVANGNIVDEYLQILDDEFNLIDVNAANVWSYANIKDIKEDTIKK